MSKRAESGIGTLIVFIAMILVAAVAAGVLIQTSSSLQSKALDVGKKSQSEVSTGLNVVQVVGDREGNMSSSNVKNMSFVVKVSAGSAPIKFADTLITVNLKDTSTTYNHGAGIACDNSPNCNYTVDYLIDGSNHRDGYLVPGDIAEVSLVASRNVTEAEKILATWILKSGATRTVDFTVPDTINTAKVYLYP